MVENFSARREMVLTVTGKGENVSSGLCSRSSSRLMWVSTERSADGNPVRTRVPEPVSAVFDSGSFSAAGVNYASITELEQPEAGGVYTDCRGRTVISLSERFPCFDSSDYLYENRYYRWWLIIEPERITRVYAEDGRDGIFVTEDVCELESQCVEALRTLGLII